MGANEILERHALQKLRGAGKVVGASCSPCAVEQKLRIVGDRTGQACRQRLTLRPTAAQCHPGQRQLRDILAYTGHLAARSGQIVARNQIAQARAIDIRRENASVLLNDGQFLVGPEIPADPAALDQCPTIGRASGRDHRVAKAN
ncbi:MAG TPA: hypothetical protein VII41_17405, partial [Steroidobacteraceae bacterium]